MPICDCHSLRKRLAYSPAAEFQAGGTWGRIAEATHHQGSHEGRGRCGVRLSGDFDAGIAAGQTHSQRARRRGAATECRPAVPPQHWRAQVGSFTFPIGGLKCTCFSIEIECTITLPLLWHTVIGGHFKEKHVCK